MRRLLFIAVSVGLFTFLLWSQFVSLDHQGKRRFKVLNQPAKEVVVGVCWPFSVNRDGMADGLQLALDEINSGKFAGEYTIRLDIRDHEFNWQKAKRIAMEFADNPGMSAVIGYYDDTPAIKASAIFESSRLLHLITGANNTAMTSHGFKYIVRTTLPGQTIALALANITAKRGYKRIAIVWEEDAYGEDLAYQYTVGLENLDIRVVSQFSFDRENPDFRLIINELKGVDADVIFFAGIEPGAGDFLRSARRIGLKTPIIGAFSDTPDMRKRAGQGLEGAMFFETYNVDSPRPENQKFVGKFRSRYGKNPDTWAAQGYDALHILAKAIKLTGSRNPLDLSYAIRYMDAWEGANGLYKFNGAGELEAKPIFLHMYQHGKSVIIDESTPASPAVPQQTYPPGAIVVNPAVSHEKGEHE